MSHYFFITHSMRMEIYLMAKTTKILNFKESFVKTTQVQSDLLGEKTISVNSLLEGHRHLRAHKW